MGIGNRRKAIRTVLYRGTPEDTEFLRDIGGDISRGDLERDKLRHGTDLLWTSIDGNFVYNSSSPKNAVGTYSTFTNISEDTLVTSSYIASVVVPPGGGSFKFNPTTNIAASGSFLRATGETTLTIS